MADILFITNDPTVEALIKDLSLLVETAIEVAADYPQGIKKIFDRRPAVVFLQDGITDVSCDKLADRVKLLLDEEPVKLVLLSADDDAAFTAGRNFDACLDLCLPMEVLFREARTILESVPSIRWKGSTASAPEEGADIIELTIADHAQFEFLPDLELEMVELPPSPPGEKGEATKQWHVAGLDELQNEFTDTASLPPRAERSAPAATEDRVTFSDTRRLVKENAGTIMESLSWDAPEPAKSSEDQKPAPLQTAPGVGGSGRKEKAPLNSPASCRPQGVKEEQSAPPLPTVVETSRAARGAIAFLLITTIIMAGGWYREASKGRTVLVQAIPQKGAGPPSGPTSPSPDLSKLLPQVPADAGYASANPGWQRYLSEGVEYLVYREEGRIRAIQMLAEQKGAISAAFFRTCLRTATGGDRYVVRSTERRDSFQVEKGALPSGAEVAVYRDRSKGEIRAFVISFPAT